MALSTTVTHLDHNATAKAKLNMLDLSQENPVLLLALPLTCTRIDTSHHSSALHPFLSIFGFKLVSLWHMDYPLLCLHALY